MSRVNDRIKGGMSRIADRATPSPDAWESVVDRISRQPEHEEMEVIMLQKNPLPTRRLGLWAASAAAVVAAIAFVGIVLVDDDSDQTTVTAPPTTESPTTAVPATTVPEVDPALEIAEQFMAARQAHDADGVMSLVATGASIALRTEWITDPGEYRQLVAYEEAVGFEFNDVTCSAGSEGRVTCVY